MGILIVTEFVTLDGVAQAPGGPDEDREDGFQHGGWQAPYDDDEAGAVMVEGASSMDALLLGRKTYDIFSSYWPTAPEDSPFTKILNDAPKYVASNTLSEPLSWAGTTLLDGDLADSINALKARHDEIQVIGSLDLVQSLLRLGLVDRLSLWVHPVVFGSGKRVFEDGTVPTALRLVEAKAYPAGAVHLVYEKAGVPSYGLMTAEGAVMEEQA